MTATEHATMDKYLERLALLADRVEFLERGNADKAATVGQLVELAGRIEAIEKSLSETHASLLALHNQHIQEHYEEINAVTGRIESLDKMIHHDRKEYNDWLNEICEALRNAKIPYARQPSPHPFQIDVPPTEPPTQNTQRQISQVPPV